jgi:hypothetical protein
MDDRDDMPKDTETILMALDQISQTIDVMTSVVGRLRTYVKTEASDKKCKPDLRAEMRPDRVLH